MFSAIVLTGLSAGLFYAWAVSVIPGTKKVKDFTYLETMTIVFMLYRFLNSGLSFF
jgi:hypothetical protein